MIRIRNKLSIVQHKFANKSFANLNNIKTSILTMISFMLLQLNKMVATVAPAFAEEQYKPTAPSVDKEGNVTLNGNGKGNIFEQMGTAITKAKPIIGVAIAGFGLLAIVGAVFYAYKGGHDITKDDSGGYTKVGYAVIGVVIFGIACVFAGIAVTVGLNSGTNFFMGK